MNTSKQLLRENTGNFTVHENLTSPAWRKVPAHTATADARRKHRRLAVLVFAGIAIFGYPVRRALAGLPHQEFEGLGVIACFLTYIGIFLWRVSRALTRDSQQAKTSEGEVTLPAAGASESAASQEEPPATQVGRRRE
jgi:hypothetical protein